MHNGDCFVSSVPVWMLGIGELQMACFMLSRKPRLTRPSPEDTGLQCCHIRQSQVLGKWPHHAIVYYSLHSIKCRIVCEHKLIISFFVRSFLNSFKWRGWLWRQWKVQNVKKRPQQVNTVNTSCSWKSHENMSSSCVLLLPIKQQRCWERLRKVQSSGGLLRASQNPHLSTPPSWKTAEWPFTCQHDREEWDTAAAENLARCNT